MQQPRFFNSGTQTKNNTHKANQYCQQAWKADKSADEYQNDEQKKACLNKAIELYTRAIESDSEYKFAYQHRGYVKGKLVRFLQTDEEKLAQYEEAVSDYTRAIDIDPGFYQAFSQRGHTRGEQGRISKQPHYHEKAIEDCTSAIEIAENKIQAYINRAWNFSELGSITQDLTYCQKAIDDCTKILELTPNDVTDYFLQKRADAYDLRAKNKEKLGLDANDDISEAAQLNPDKYGSLTNRLNH